MQSLSGDNAQKYNLLPQISFTVHDIEQNDIFEKQIIGNENSRVAGLINKLGNSDWVKDGIKYLPSELNQEKEACPFCQQKTITEELIDSIKNYFDETFESDINSLKKLLKRYSEATETIPEISVFENNPMYEPFEKDFELKYNAFKQIIETNTELIEDKIKSPSVPINLKDSSSVFNDLVDLISEINERIINHNNKIDKKESEFKKLKAAFWDLMRWEYDNTINSLNAETKKSHQKIKSLKNKVQDFKDEISKQNDEIVKQQKKTVNIEEAISNINNGLIDLGIEDFKIKHHSENLYKLVRGESDENIFESLSEGEKMVISFLYFLEQCRGKRDVSEAAKKKIIVIDDPISSLSHIYIFNIGRFIHSEFLRSEKYEQVFVLTHSLYFFYELTDTNHDRRKENQKLFRLRKNSNGSKIIEMSYDEIQNDYHSYWFIIKDDQQPPSLIANCMRNVIEYFFNFVEKQDLNNVFQKPSLQENRFQAFCRYINRESHSLGQNIFDIKEFNYNDFKDAFALVFKETGYEAHYKKMMK